MKPKLQVALDLESLDEALEIANQVNGEADIIEIGTILAIEAGLNSVRKLRKELPNQRILADIRIIKAGGRLAKMAYEAGANIVTIISDATKETFESVIKVRDEKPGREVLIEINDNYDDEMLKYWKKNNLTHLIYHRGSEITDANENWSDVDFEEIKRLDNLGFKVFVTGGIGIEEISLFQDVPVECFIIGRTIVKAESPRKAAQVFNEAIRNEL